MDLTLQMHLDGAWRDGATLSLLDPDQGVVRTVRWNHPPESPGAFDWQAIARSLGDLISPDRLIHELEALARRLVGLADRLESRGVPERVLTSDIVGLPHLDARLKQCGLA